MPASAPGGLKWPLTFPTVLTTPEAVELMAKALCNVSPPAVSSLWVPTVRALRGVEPYCPLPPPSSHSTSGAHQKLSALLCKRSSSWELRGGVERGDEKRAANSFPGMLQTFRNASSGRGQRLGVEECLFLRPSALGSAPHKWISTLLLTLPWHTLYASLQLYSRKRRQMIPQPAVPKDTHPLPKFCLLWTLGFISVSVVAAMTSS